jgi:hypothetical protein
MEMDSPDHEPVAEAWPHLAGSGQASDAASGDVDSEDAASVAELAARLVSDPGELGAAVEGLEALEPETRGRIIEELARVSSDPAVARLLDRLRASEDPATRAAVDAAHEPETPPAVGEASREHLPRRTNGAPRLVRTVVTAVDGDGLASVGLSAEAAAERTSAVFFCDLKRGIVDAVGVVEAESPRAGNSLNALREHAGVLSLEAVPDLAIGLLASTLLLNGPEIDAPVREWLARTLGEAPVASPLGLPTDQTREIVPHEELERCAETVLDACPTWLDGSSLTFEMAEEISLREGRVPADPARDSGAFRYLFEHRVIHRLELYRRMLLWMAGFWTAAAEKELARSATILGAQLADRQFAVPSHPFTVAITARSLDAARERLGTENDPRAGQPGRRRRPV